MNLWPSCLISDNSANLDGVSFTQMVQVVSAEATSVYVSEAMGSDANDGLDWDSAKKSIQSGVDACAYPQSSTTDR